MREPGKPIVRRGRGRPAGSRIGPTMTMLRQKNNPNLLAARHVREVLDSYEAAGMPISQEEAIDIAWPFVSEGFPRQVICKDVLIDDDGGSMPVIVVSEEYWEFVEIDGVPSVRPSPSRLYPDRKKVAALLRRNRDKLI